MKERDKTDNASAEVNKVLTWFRGENPVDEDEYRQKIIDVEERMKDTKEFLLRAPYEVQNTFIHEVLVAVIKERARVETQISQTLEELELATQNLHKIIKGVGL